MSCMSPDQRQVPVRMPPALHNVLKTKAAEQGISVNKLIVILLAGGTNFKLPKP